MTYQPKTLIESLEYWSAAKPGHTALQFLQNNSVVDRLTYEELQVKSMRLAGLISSHTKPGDRVLLVFEAGLDFVVAFYACQYAGVIAVPCCMPRGFSKHQAIHSI